MIKAKICLISREVYHRQEWMSNEWGLLRTIKTLVTFRTKLTLPCPKCHKSPNRPKCYVERTNKNIVSFMKEVNKKLYNIFLNDY